MEEKKNGELSAGAGTSDLPRVGRLFWSHRVARSLRIVEVARQSGLRDTAKVLRHIDRLEQEGLAPLDLVKTLCAFFGITTEAVKEAWKLDEADRRRLRWEAAGGRPHFIFSVMPGVYFQKAVPEGLDRTQMIEWSRALLREKWPRCRGSLVVSPHEIIWLRENGTFFVTDNAPPPSMTVRGKRFIFRQVYPAVSDRKA